MNVFFRILEIVFTVISLINILIGDADVGDYLLAGGFLFFLVADFIVKKYKL